MKAHKTALLAVVVITAAAFFFFDLQRFLTLASLKANRQLLLDYYSSHKLVMAAGFMALYILQTALSLPGAAILSLAAGAIFGSIMGTLYANIAATIGASLATIDSISGIASPRVLGSFALLGLIALLPVIYNRIKKS